MPKLVFPGGALIGCAAGFMNVPRIKGSHNAMLSGILAAEHVATALAEGRAHDEVAAYEAAWRASDIGRDLKLVRNVKPLWSKYGTYLGAPLFDLDMWTNELFGFCFFGTLKHGKADHECLKSLSEVTPIVCGDFLNDYEGIRGYEEFHADLAVMYFAEVDPASEDLVALEMVPLQIRHFQQNRPGSAESSGCKKLSMRKVKALARGSKRSRMEGLRYLGLEAPRDLRFGIASLECLHATIP